MPAARTPDERDVLTTTATGSANLRLAHLFRTYRLDLYNALALLLVLAAAFAYVNQRFLKMPTAIGLMVLGLVASLALVGLARFDVKPVLDLRIW